MSAAHTDKKAGCLNTPLKKGCCACTCVVLIAVAVVVPVYIFVLLPAQLMQQLKDGLAFYPCEVKICSAGAVSGDCPYLCHATIDSSINITECATLAGYRASPAAIGGGERLGFEMKLKASNAIDFDIDIDHLALVITSTTGVQAKTDNTVLAIDYLSDANPALVACVLQSPVTLAKKAWTSMDFHCEIKADAGLQPLFLGFMSGGDLGTLTTYAASADTPLGTQTLTGTYSGGGSSAAAAGDTLFDKAECPALEPVSAYLESGLAPPYGAGAVISGYQCAGEGSTTFTTILPTCAVSSADFKNDAVTAFLCCIVKATDGIQLMLPLFDALGLTAYLPTGR